MHVDNHVACECLYGGVVLVTGPAFPATELR